MNQDFLNWGIALFNLIIGGFMKGRSYNGNSVALGGGGTATTLGQHSLILMEISGS